jgi:hypothetical protein
MISRRRVIMGGLVALGTTTFVGTACAKHQHHNGQQLVGNKINANGKHDLHKVGDHTVSIQVSNKKVAGLTVSHRTKGNVAVKKYKSSKKMAHGTDLGREADSDIQLAAYQIAQSIVYIGYAFSDGIDEYIYWFPAEMVVDPFTGAVDYIPLA